MGVHMIVDANFFFHKPNTLGAWYPMNMLARRCQYLDLVPRLRVAPLMQVRHGAGWSHLIKAQRGVAVLDRNNTSR